MKGCFSVNMVEHNTQVISLPLSRIGLVCESFRDAAERLGLIEADSTLDDCLTEAE